jgi:ABC-type multidrug transport system fused ATPase/permease subunit
VDAASESRITDALQRLRSGRTTIIIAHRLSTIAQADQIAVVSDGRIVESGTPDDLRARGGRFADLLRPLGRRRRLTQHQALIEPPDADSRARRTFIVRY